ncbi:MAG: FG-GAP-like repeat-containing protein, partial [Bacteroidota bacterium]
MKNIYKLTTASLIGLLLLIQLPYTSYGQAVLYNSLSQSFTGSFVSSNSQCTDFENWRATLTRTDYTVLNIRSNASSYVATCTNPTIVQAMATFLRTISTPGSFTSQTWTDGSNTWMIGSCIGIEVMQNAGSICNCASGSNVAVFRSCILNANWGGVGGPTCGAASQTLTIEFGYPNTQSLNFDGVNDYCTRASTTNLNLIDSFTIEAWIKPTSFTASAGIISKYQNPSNRGFTLRTGAVSPYTSIDFMGLTTATGVLSASTWYHVAVVANNSQGNPKIYINGVLTSTTGTYLQPVTNTDSVTIGCEYRTSPRYFNGNIDEVRIWNRIVTQQELAYHMGCAAVPTTATNLIAYYRFDQGTVNGTNTSITSLLDSSGNGSHMALRNFALTGTTSNFVVGNVGGSCPTYLPSPVISSFSPISGSVGSSVTLTGYNFSAIPANNTVYFGGVKATVTAASTISLTVTVPTGATYSPITVYVNNLMDQSIIPFNVIFPGGAGISSSSFQTKVDFAAGTNPVGSALADLDGDGKMDIVVTNGSSNTISVYRNISLAGSITSGSFAAKVDFATGTVPSIIVVGDLDGDGKLDLAVSNNSASTISIFRNTSTSGSITTSSFAAKVDFSVGSNPRGIALNDIDGDGKLDIAVGNNTGNTVSVLYNTSTSGSITSGSFAAQLTFSSSSPNDIVFSDIDGDGKAEMLVANGASNITSVYLNTASRGSITSSSFATAATYTTGSFAQGVATGDIDGDGKQDMVIVNSSSNTVSLFRNTSTLGSLGFAAKVDFTTGTTPSSVKLGDLDGDNKVDLIIPNNSSSTISVFRNTATSGTISSGSLAAKVDFSVGSYPALVSVGDIDGDGRMDMVSPNNASATVSVIKYNGTASITTQPQSADMCIGGAASFSVVAAGSGTLTYQWYKNGASISGATSATF